MAKVQGLPLNPTKISGVCGRLLCCLAYEKYDAPVKPVVQYYDSGVDTKEIKSLDDAEADVSWE